MGAILLHHPLVQLFLLYLAALWVALIWDSFRNRPAARDGAGNRLHRAAQGGASAPPPRAIP
jgi:hypothetical protein